MVKKSVHRPRVIPRVIVDCDDVLFDCNEFAIRILNQKLNSSYTINDLFKWGKLGNDLDLRLSLFDDPKFVDAQPAYPDAAAIQGDYMIDDSAANLSSNPYCEPILFSRPWNTECHSIQRIESLNDFFPIFFQKEGLSNE